MIDDEVDDDSHGEDGWLADWLSAGLAGWVWWPGSGWLAGWMAGRPASCVGGVPDTVAIAGAVGLWMGAGRLVVFWELSGSCLLLDTRSFLFLPVVW